jgi:YHS domain-containing protein
MCMEKSRRRLASYVCLLVAGLLAVAGCRQTCNHCADGTCDVSSRSAGAAPASAPAGAYAGQRTCPVTGAALTSAAKPVAVAAKGETIYVCCQGCALKVRLNPEPYLAKVRAERASSAGTAMATPAPLALGGQKNCPVTGEPLDPNGAVPVTVRGQTIYVCCQGCAAKVSQNPEPYLAKVVGERSVQVGAGR